MASRPAPNRQFETTFPTPLIGDVLFKERTVCQSRNVPAYGTAHPNTQRWPDHKLVFVSERGEPDSQDTYDFFYAADRDSQDLYNFSFTKADIGPTKFNAVTRTYVSPRATFDPIQPVMGTQMPNVPVDKFQGEYVLAQHREIRIGQQELDSLYVAEEMTWVKKVTLTDISYDETFGGVLKTSQTLRYRGEIIIPATTSPVAPAITIEQLMDNDTVNYWGLQSDGIAREGSQLTDNWFVVTEKQVIPSFMADAGRQYNTSANAFWPAVLLDIRIEGWERKDGGAQVYMMPVYKREAYRGSCDATVFEKWYAEPPDDEIQEVTSMQPLPIHIQSPFFAVNVGPTLHGNYDLVFTNGNVDPIFKYTGAEYPFPATCPIDWPETQIVQDEVRPYRGGYLRTRVTVQQPKDQCPVTPVEEP